MKAEATLPDVKHMKRAFINHDSEPSACGQSLIWERLKDAKQVTLVLGQNSEHAIREILALAEYKNWLLVTTPIAKGLVPSSHPLYRGVFGLGGHSSAREALLAENAEHVVVIGSPLGEITTGGWDSQAVFSNRLIHISDNPEHLSRSIMSQISVLGSPKEMIRKLLDRVGAEHQPPALVAVKDEHGFHADIDYRDKAACVDLESTPVKPQSLFWNLSQWVPDNTHALMDTGNSFLWGIHYWQGPYSLESEHKQFHIGMGFATMGWAIGAAIGMAFANPDEPIICFTGDGSVLMAGQEITVAQEHELNILFVILNDAHLGMIKHGQALGGAESVANELPNVDFALLANSMGVKGHRVSTVQQLKDLNVKGLFEQPGPVVLDVLVDAEQVPPMGSRMKVLAGEAFHDVA